MIYDENSFLPDVPDSQGFSQHLIDALPMPVYLKSEGGTILMGNKAFCCLLNCGNMELRGKKVMDFLEEDQAGQFDRFDQDLLADEGTQNYEARIRTGSGVSCEYAFQKSLLHDSKNEVIGIVCSMIDLSEQKKAERQMEEAQEATVMASAMLHKIRAGIVIVGSDMRVIDSNPGFAKLIGGDVEELAETVPGLSGADLKELVPDVLYRMFATLMSSGENMVERDLRYQNKLLHVSVISIYKNRVVGALIRDMSAPALVREEIISRAQRVNKQNMETVQKIAFLLGENASVMEELLHSIIESYKYGEDEPS
ncbi:PAS domain-containing protein [Mangrovibacterium lignilyticum]|uniref:PAS domain-containing protein n=1 Tax=Mangrovibacterium lignilyticum TaxID=2668052 RepID=UPI0013D829D6|nr:PAS domain-containing protein [Mangrovibacterium lignilyticum]